MVFMSTMHTTHREGQHSTEKVKEIFLTVHSILQGISVEFIFFEGQAQLCIKSMAGDIYADFKVKSIHLQQMSIRGDQPSIRMYNYVNYIYYIYHTCAL